MKDIYKSSNEKILDENAFYLNEEDGNGGDEFELESRFYFEVKGVKKENYLFTIALRNPKVTLAGIRNREIFSTKIEYQSETMQKL